MTPSKTLYLGTKNPGKLAEYRAGLAVPGWNFPAVEVEEPAEEGESFADIAEDKARYYATAEGGLTLAEDSGLVVPALFGLPGIFSARFADCALNMETGEVCAVNSSGRSRAEMDQANNARLLELMSDVPDEERKAYYLAHLAIAKPDGSILISRTFGFHGAIARKPRGNGGFGYDFIFAPEGFDGKMASELSTEEKNAVSHRGQGLAFLALWLDGFSG